MTRLIRALTLACALPLLACGAPDASASADGASEPPVETAARNDAGDLQEVLGTIEATIAGEPTEFFVISGDMRGQPYASATWFEPEEGKIMLAVGGLDTPTPPLDTFESGPSGTPVSFGDYDGPALSLVIEVDADPEPFSMDLPADENMSSAVYMSVASVGDMNTAFMLASGSLNVTQIQRSGRRMSVEGTFSGTVRSMGDGTEIEIRDGRFSASNIPHLDEVRPESG